MGDNRFTFEFEEISDKVAQSKLQIVDHRNNRQFETQVSIDDRVVLRERGLQVKPYIADLMDLAVSIYVADRWARRKAGYPREIEVRLPIRTERVRHNPGVIDCLRLMLHWFTGDLWTFRFSRRSRTRRVAELQTYFFPTTNTGVVTEVALWSGGLDALAGLCNRIKSEYAERFLLVGTGANPSVWGLQERSFKALCERREAQMNLIRLQIFQRRTGQLPWRSDRRSRARVAAFAILGSAYALLEQQTALAVYENGPGALNLPFRASEVGLDHSRGVHPLSLAWISYLVSIISDTDFTVHNPFIHWTKAEMCSVLDKMNLSAVAGITQSCDRSPRSKIPQCGTCSSCILRRQALLASGIPDTSNYLVHKGTDQQRKKYLAESHLPYMMFQVRNLRQIFDSESARDDLMYKYPTLLGDIPMRLSTNSGYVGSDFALGLVQVLRRYGQEWSLTEVQKGFESEYADIVN